jgi:hypothetical protein
MTNPRAFAVPLSTGQKVPATAFNALDDGQFWAIPRKGTTPLLANVTLQAAGHGLTLDFSDNAASLGQINNGDNDFAFNSSGAGLFLFPSDKFKLLGTSWPAMDARSVTDYVPPCSPFFDTAVAPVAFSADTAGRLTQIVSGSTLNFWLGLPIGTVIKSLSIALQKGPSAGALPSSMPSIYLGYYDLATGAFVSVIAPFSDTSANLAAFQAYHTVTTGTVTHTVAGGRNYLCGVAGDNTSSSLTNGLRIHRPSLSVETSVLRQF